MKRITDVLKGIFLFQDVPRAIDNLLSYEVITFKKGEEICRGVDCASYLGVVLSGTCKSTPLGDGNALLKTFSKGDVFGAANVFCNEDIAISKMTAVSECEVILISQSQLTELFNKFPQIAVNYITFLSSRIKFLNSKISIFTEIDGENKVYRFLKEHSDSDGNIFLPASMSTLAKTLDMGRTSLYRELEKLEQKNIIKKEKGVYKLL